MKLTTRRGFSLLEVMIALAILTISLVLLVETQSNAVWMTREAERQITAADLAHMKMQEAKLRLEGEGFTPNDVYEKGEFDDFGDDSIDIEFKELEDYHWEYSIAEVDVALAGNIGEAAGKLDSSGVMGGGGDGGGLAGAMGGGGLGSMMSPEAISEMLAPYVREVRVRVWWGENTKEAEENGTEVVVVGHAINPSGVISIQQELPQ